MLPRLALFACALGLACAGDVGSGDAVRGNGTAGAGGATGDVARSGDALPVEVTDDARRVVRLEAPATRVVSLVPSVTDIVLALGAQDRLIARTEYDVDPRLARLPSVGPGLTPNLEWLASQAPDLVIAWRDVEGRALVERLGELGIPVYASRLEDVATALGTIERLGALLGLRARADSLRDDMAARLDSVRAATRDWSRPTVLYLVGEDPPYAPGPGTFVHELIGIAGGSNLLADLPDGWHSLSAEEVVRRDPDVIVIPVHGGERGSARGLSARPGWRELRAVREGRVFEVDGELFGRPGPRLDEAAVALADLLGRTGARTHAREGLEPAVSAGDATGPGLEPAVRAGDATGAGLEPAVRAGDATGAP